MIIYWERLEQKMNIFVKVNHGSQKESVQKFSPPQLTFLFTKFHKHVQVINNHFVLLATL